MVESQHSVLRIQPHMIPRLRAEFLSAVTQVSAALTDLNRRGYLPAPWMGDQISAEAAAYYTRRAMDGSDSSYQSLVAYRDELSRSMQALEQMEAAYLHSDSAAAHPFRPTT